MVIIGVTDEAEGLAKPYTEKNKLEYLIAYGGGASGYSTNGIPAAWLVAPNGKIVWKGHPSGLNEGIIEEHLKDVRLRPSFEFASPALKKAGKQLEAGKYGKGISELETVIAGSDDSEAVDAAKAALEQVLKYGEEELQAVEEYAKAGFYLEGMVKLQQLTALFKGTEIGTRADEKNDVWRKDKRIKAEIEGAEAIGAAKELVANRKWKDAARLLVGITRGKKFEGTKAQKEAEALLSQVEPYL